MTPDSDDDVRDDATPRSETDDRLAFNDPARWARRLMFPLVVLGLLCAYYGFTKPGESWWWILASAAIVAAIIARRIAVRGERSTF
ncbi:MAG: hypothetical protein AAGK78_09125 [Planctomycetota bacterium]